MSADLLHDLTRAKAVFQLRTVEALLREKPRGTCDTCGLSRRVCECVARNGTQGGVAG